MNGLVSLARSPEDLKKDEAYGTIMPHADPSDIPIYPWGTCITLCNEELAKLDLEGECEAGDEIMFVARAEVKDASQTKMADGSIKRRIELQIVAMKVSNPVGDAMGDGDADDRKISRYKGSSEA